MLNALWFSRRLTNLEIEISYGQGDFSKVDNIEAIVSLIEEYLEDKEENCHEVNNVLRMGNLENILEDIKEDFDKDEKCVAGRGNKKKSLSKFMKKTKD